MALYDANHVPDFLQLLCLMEAISFEDFEFATVFSELLAWVAGRTRSHGCTLPTRIGGKRLVLLHSAVNEANCDIEENDIACVHPTAPLSSSRLDHEAHLFSALAKPGLRACLLYDAIEPAIGLDLLRLVGGEKSVEWAFSVPTGRRTSGLLFSYGWKRGGCEQVVAVLHSYLPTLAPSTRRGFSNQIQMRGDA
ncbi:hypothetical protein [Bradyrhizobium sp. BWA-3-5]|uniref:hypothetical protein n=1 Tax=Bradyrhizobium sp. BWA-3-5 TaxID=3080013 RepID=UPI00293F1CB7|nr:hypothetical protein [Bradyrhizobium sp. BWA-3-5]WOH64159.1 hypothetical protein RX331_26675 [Bradyrhizobium sp. BWA-3-5]WOH64276.1 hypothetical protein RX331_27415 [Bradyrhizobium sp. BWA-3-5]WOH70204.1 hypothetical protein RX331_38600 [Bradyrhizobium sp. BWA-3-5]